MVDCQYSPKSECDIQTGQLNPLAQACWEIMTPLTATSLHPTHSLAQRWGKFQEYLCVMVHCQKDFGRKETPSQTR